MGLLQVVPLGGAGEIGKNCTAIVQGDEMVLVDVGLSFPDEDQFGVDIVIPDFSFILENRHKLKGIFLTHAHEDHVGALSYLLPHVKCPVYATQFTAALVRTKFEEKNLPTDFGLKMVQPGDKVQAGELSVEFVRVTHSIPETCSLAIHTQHGAILFTSDFKFDFTPVDGKLTDIARLSELGKEGVLLLVSDSTNADRRGWGPSESIVSEGFRRIFESAPGRVLITTFASNVHRMQQAIDVAEKVGRKVSVAGRRMDTTIELCGKLGYMRLPRQTYIKLDEIGKYQPHELVILTTGSQGEPMAALSQMARDEYSRMKLQPGDTVLYSARPIPGNEAAIWRTINALFAKGANVVYDSDMPVHVSGHAYQEELKMMINLTRPYYVAPVHGEARHQHLYNQMARAMGYPDHRVFQLRNGTPLCMDDQKAWIGDPVQVGEVLIDDGGHSVPREVMVERGTLGHEGVMVVTLGVDLKKGFIVRRPVIEARGFSGLPEAIEDARLALEDQLGGMSKQQMSDRAQIESTVQDVVKRVIGRKSRQRPLIVCALVDTPGY